MKRIVRSTLQTAVNLVFFAILGTATLALVHMLTKGAIEHTMEQEKMKLIGQVLPPSAYDNNLMQDAISIAPDNLLGSSQIRTAHVARLKGAPAAIVLEAVANEGYAGNIELILAIRANGELSGVRVISHKETPGLGDYIELGKSTWITVFKGQSLNNPNEAGWKVKKDGGQFDYMAGATITPRAVIKGVHHVMQYFELHRDELFAAQTPKGDSDER